MEKIIITRAKQEDIPSIGKLLYQVNKVHSDLRPDLFKSGTKKYTDEEIKRILDDPDRPVFLAKNAEKTLGYAMCIKKQFVDDNNMTDIKTLYIDDLCVDENARGQGVGTALYEFAVDYAKRNDYYNITLNVWADNISAVNFYNKIGLKIQKIGMEKILHDTTN